MSDRNLFYAESQAYHEAAHIVVAAVQGLRLLKFGMRVDPTDRGMGLAVYECRKPHDSQGFDEFGERTVVSLYAG